MTRVIRLLLLAVLLGPQVLALLPAEVLCAESRDCCAPEASCDVDCLACACCATRPPSLTPTASEAPVEMEAGTLNSAAAAVQLSLRTTDILHVPKSA